MKEKTQDKIKELLTRMTKPVTHAEWCKRVGVKPTTVYSWRDNYPHRMSLDKIQALRAELHRQRDQIDESIALAASIEADLQAAERGVEVEDCEI